VGVNDGTIIIPAVAVALLFEDELSTTAIEGTICDVVANKGIKNATMPNVNKNVEKHPNVIRVKPLISTHGALPSIVLKIPNKPKKNNIDNISRVFSASKINENPSMCTLPLFLPIS